MIGGAAKAAELHDHQEHRQIGIVAAVRFHGSARCAFGPVAADTQPYRFCAARTPRSHASAT